MSNAVVVVLAVAWAVVLLPGALRDLRRRAPSSTVGEFARSRSALRGGSSAANPLVRLHRGIRSPFDPPAVTGAMRMSCGGARAAPSAGRERVLKRRQSIVTWLGACTGVTILAAAVGDGWLLAPAVLCGVAFSTYLVLLAEQITRERDRALRARARRPAARPRAPGAADGSRSTIPA